MRYEPVCPICGESVADYKGPCPNPTPAPDPAEAMRAKCTGKTSTCYCWEPIEGTHLARTCRGSGQCLAALKGNGEGEE